MNRTTVLKLYQDVIEDVIGGVRDLFAEDGVDDQVLQELRQTWEQKLMASKAVDNQSELDKQVLAVKKEDLGSQAKPKQSTAVKQVVGQVPPNNHVQTQQVIPILETKMVPIQITLPAQAGTLDPPRVLTIQVPAAALQGNQLHKVLTGPVISATMDLPQNVASRFLQQHVNAAFTQQLNIKTVIQQNDGPADEADCETKLDSCSSGEPAPSSSKTSIQFSISRVKRPLKKRQTDGPADTSDDDDEASDDDDVSDEPEDDKDDEDPEMEAEGPEEEPLNSEDDVSEEDPSELFDTENVVVCQYDKITRSRNKWKFHLKDGIMNLNGEDYVFQKASGDAEW